MFFIVLVYLESKIMWQSADDASKPEAAVCLVVDYLPPSLASPILKNTSQDELLSRCKNLSNLLKEERVRMDAVQKSLFERARHAECRIAVLLSQLKALERQRALLSYRLLKAVPDGFGKYLRMSKQDFDYDLKILSGVQGLQCPRASYCTADLYAAFVYFVSVSGSYTTTATLTCID